MIYCDNPLLIKFQTFKDSPSHKLLSEGFVELDLHNSNVAAIKDLLYTFIASNKIRSYNFNST